MLNTITNAYTTIMSVERSFVAGKVFKTHNNDFTLLHYNYDTAIPSYNSIIGTDDSG